MLRVLVTPAFVIFMVLSNTHPSYRFFAFIIFGFAAATDWFDGQIARRTNTVSKFGVTADPLADRLFIGATLVTLYLMRMLPLAFLIIVLGRDIIMVLGYPVIRKIDPTKIAVHWTGKVATATLFVALGMLILTPPPHTGSLVGFSGYEFFSATSWQTWGLWLFMVGAFWSLVSAGVYVKRVVELLREEKGEGAGQAAESETSA